MALSGEGCRCVSSELTTAGDFDDPAVASKGGGIGVKVWTPADFDPLFEDFCQQCLMRWKQWLKGYFGQQLLRKQWLSFDNCFEQLMLPLLKQTFEE